MATKPPVMVNGQRVGRFRASWLLFKETWRFLRLDPEIPLIPLAVGIVNLLLAGVLVVGIISFHLTVQPLFEVTAAEEVVFHPLAYAFIFFFYVLSAFALAFSQGAIAHTVITRLRGGNASLGDSLRSAAACWPALFIWGVITATVGLIIQIVAERFQGLGRIVVRLVGVAWAVLTYFVAPAIVIDRVGAVTAIKRSGTTLRQTFGETVMTNIGLGLLFAIVYVFSVLAIFGLAVAAYGVAGWVGVSIALGCGFIFLFVIGLIQSSLEAILKTLLYAYVMEHTVPPNFNAELLANVLVRNQQDAATTGQVPPVQSTI